MVNTCVGVTTAQLRPGNLGVIRQCRQQETLLVDSPHGHHSEIRTSLPYPPPQGSKSHTSALRYWLMPLYISIHLAVVYLLDIFLQS